MSNKYLILSVLMHGVILCILILTVNWHTPRPVFENTPKNDIISAIILGDVATSKIVPKEPPPPVSIEKVAPSDKTPISKPLVSEKTIPLPELDKKKLAEEKMLEELKKTRELFAKDLLKDIQKTHANKKKVNQKLLETQFTQTLKEQSEKSLREQLLNEEIRLQGKQSRQSQGEINKYKALILQAISERWVVPPEANKSLYCELYIRLSPKGVVLDAQVIKSSGDKALDRSARAAVLNASPLPVPSDKNIFEPFKQFTLKVKPENIMGDSLAFLREVAHINT